MIEDELIKIWQSSSNQERIKFQKSKLMIELESSLRRLHRWWNYLEQVNVISAIVSVLAFVFIVFMAPYTSVKIASVFIILWSIYVGIRMSRIKKLKPNDLEESYLAYLEKTRAYLLAQKRMLETSLNWVILTIYPILLLSFVDLWEIKLARYVAVFAFLALVGIGIYEYFRSKRRVTTQIMPRINRIDELIKELKV